MHILKDNKIILQGHRNFQDGLWDVQIPSVPPPPPLYQKMDANYIITKDKSKTDLARYLHATAFSPSITTFIKAIKNENFITWPGIDTLNFAKLLGTTKATELGHLDQERANLQSTKHKEEEDEDFSPLK